MGLLLKVLIGLGLIVSIYEGEAMAKDFSDQIELLRQSEQQTDVLQAWVKQNPDEARQLRDLLVSDAIFNRLQFISGQESESLRLLKVLYPALPHQWLEYEDLPLDKAIKLLESPDFHNQIISPRKEDQESSSINGLAAILLNYGQTYVFATAQMAQLSNVDLGITLSDQLSFIEGEDEGPSPDMLYLQFYMESVGGDADPTGLKDLMIQAESSHRQTLATLIQIELGKQLAKQDPSAATKVFNQALAKAQALNNPVLEIQSLIYQPNLALEKVKARIKSLPEENEKLYLSKLLADQLFLNDQDAAAWQIYRELIKEGPAWLQIWLLKTFTSIQDRKVLPEIEALIHNPDVRVSEEALITWLSLLDWRNREAKLKTLAASLTEKQLAFLIAHLPQNLEEPPDFVIQALESNRPVLQLGALNYLQQLSEYHAYTQTKLFTKAKTLLKSTDPEVRFYALKALIRLNIFEPEMINLLDQESPQRADILILLQSKAEKIPVEKLKLLLKASDTEVRLSALALLLIKGQRSELNDFLSLWKHERFYNVYRLNDALAQALQTGKISWTDWRKALETTYQDENSSGQGYKLLYSLVNLKPFPQAGLTQLDELLQHPKLEIRRAVVGFLLQPNLPRKATRTQLIAEMAKQSEDKDLQVMALNYLAQEKSLQWLDLFRQAETSENEEVQQTARAYLIRWDSTRILQQLEQPDKLSPSELTSLVRMMTSRQMPITQLKPILKRLFTRIPEQVKMTIISELIQINPDYLEAELLNQQLRKNSTNLSLLKFFTEKPGWLENKTLQEMLYDHKPDTQAIALFLTRIKGDPKLIPSLMPLLKQHDQIRPEVINAFPYADSQRRKGLTIRELTLRTLIALDQSAAVPALIEFLQDPDPVLRSYALSQIKELELSAFSPEEIEKWLVSNDSQLRFFALETKERLQSRSKRQRFYFPLEVWLPFLKDENPEIRKDVLWKIERYPDLDLNYLKQMLKDPDPEVQKLAQQLLDERLEKAQGITLAQYLERIKSEPYQLIRLKKDHLPNGLKAEELYQGLIELIDKEKEIDMHYFQALIKLKGRQSLPDLLRYAKSHYLPAYLLEELITKADLPLVIKLVQKDSSAEELQLGIDLLDTLKATEAISFVWQHLNHQDSSVRESAYRFIGHQGSEADRLKLIAKLESPTDKSLALEALEAVPIPQAFAQILNLLKHSNEDVRRSAIRLSGAWKIKSALPELLTLIDDKTPLVLRYNAIHAIGNMGAQEALPNLRTALKLEPESLILIETLYKLQDDQTASPALKLFLEQASSDDRIDGLDLLREVKDTKLLPYVLTLLSSRESGTLNRQGVYRINSFEVGEMATTIFAEIAGPDDIPALIKELPKLSQEHQESVGYIIEKITQRYPTWPAEVISQLKTLSQSNDSIIRLNAQKWLNSLKTQ